MKKFLQGIAVMGFMFLLMSAESIVDMILKTCGL